MVIQRAVPAKVLIRIVILTVMTITELWDLVVLFAIMESGQYRYQRAKKVSPVCLKSPIRPSELYISSLIYSNVHSNW